ncbi:unnamed protein product, partial [Choristocarpus tenellus]
KYAAFLWLLLETITQSNIIPPSFKKDRDIECIMEKDVTTGLEGGHSAKERHMGVTEDPAGFLLPQSGTSDPKATISPKLKDVHFERMQALRVRLEALKEIRARFAPPNPGLRDSRGTVGDGSDTGKG